MTAPTPPPDAGETAWLLEWASRHIAAADVHAESTGLVFQMARKVRELQAERTQYREALEAMRSEFRQADLPYGSHAYLLASQALAAHQPAKEAFTDDGMGRCIHCGQKARNHEDGACYPSSILAQKGTP